MSDCLTAADFECYDDGRLDAAAAVAVRDHLDTCETCRAAYERFRRQARSANDAQVPKIDETELCVTPMPTGSSPATKVARQFPRIEGYRITGVIGQGGMGIVYQAVQTKLNRTVALKVLPAIVGTANPSAVSRFRREAAAAARLHHTNIIPIYDYGESRDGYYYAMELISGQPLDVLIRRLGEQDASTASVARLAELLTSLDVAPASDAVAQDGSSVSLGDSGSGTSFSGRGRMYYRHVTGWMANAADALHYAHVQGIIHRDVKPGNLILSIDGRILIADFGLAKVAEEKSVTMTGSFLGTLRYVSPEQAMARRVRVDHRTDIYSLGATMYELLCFQPAFPGADDKEILGAIIARDPTSPRKINHAVPPELDTICLKCLEKSPDARYDSAKSLADDLRRYTHDLPIIARRPGLIRRTAKFVKRRKAPVIAVTAAVLLAASAVLWQWEKAAGRSAGIMALRESAINFVLLNRWAEAENDFRAALRIDRNDVETLLNLAWMKLEYYKARPHQASDRTLKQADQLCRHVLQIDTDNVKALGYQAVALKRLGRYAEAIETVEKSLALHPGDYASWSNLGALHAVQGDLKNAEECLRRGADAAGVQPDEYHAAVWRNRAVLELHLQNVASVTHIANAIECYEQDILTRIVRARLWLQLTGHIDFEEALDDAKFADKLANETNAKAKRIRALAHLRNDEFQHAIKHARLALDLDDLPTINHLIIAVAEARRGNESAARTALAVAEATWPADLRQPGGFIATAGTGDLWIESADELLRLRDELVALVGPSMP